MSLDPQWTDVLLALDIVPVGYITSSYVEGGTFPWQGDLLEGSTPIPFVDEIPFEAIDELDPDLILGTYSIEESDYQTLSKKAPTIPSITDAEVESWTVLAATSTGAVAVVDMAGATALNTPSPLSIPYGLEQIRPALETAAG